MIELLPLEAAGYVFAAILIGYIGGFFVDKRIKENADTSLWRNAYFNLKEETREKNER